MESKRFIAHMPSQATSTQIMTQNDDTAQKTLRLTLDGRRFKKLFKAGYLWLKQQEQTVNAYNVYPVPDGDTGTNMMHTMRAAWEAIANMDERSIGLVAKAISAGALRGSRGNSGIILSQLWRGVARSLEGKDVADAQDIAQAFRSATKTAYAGISSPVEGTILTVSRETADSAEQLAQQTHDLDALLDGVVRASFESAQRTPNLLKILKDAGVIDSGGYGFFVILDGMRRFVNGETIESEVVVAATRAMTGNAATDEEAGYGYDVQYLIYARSGAQLNVNDVRAKIEAMGECPLVMGDGEVIKVHVHVPDPGVPISYGASLGSLRDVVVEDMQAQSEEFLPGQVKPADAVTEHADEVDLALVAVSAGEGITRVFHDVGARAIVPGGQTMNPSVQDILDAIKHAKAKEVIVLPNNGNIILTARQACEMSEIPARVVPTRTIPQGIAASIAFNFLQDMTNNLEAMNAAAGRSTTCEITTATRDVTLNGVEVRDGQVIGLIDDKLACAGDDVGVVLLNTLEIGGAASRELITAFYGNGLDEAHASALLEPVKEKYPDAALEVYPGLQPHYHFVVGLE